MPISFFATLNTFFTRFFKNKHLDQVLCEKHITYVIIIEN